MQLLFLDERAFEVAGRAPTHLRPSERAYPPRVLLRTAFKISGEEDGVLRAATEHAASFHGDEDTPELRRNVHTRTSALLRLPLVVTSWLFRRMLDGGPRMLRRRLLGLLSFGPRREAPEPFVVELVVRRAMVLRMLDGVS